MRQLSGRTTIVTVLRKRRNARSKFYELRATRSLYNCTSFDMKCKAYILSGRQQKGRKYFDSFTKETYFILLLFSLTSPLSRAHQLIILR